MGPVAFDQRVIVSKTYLDQSAFVVVISMWDGHVQVTTYYIISTIFFYFSILLELGHYMVLFSNSVYILHVSYINFISYF